MLYQSILMKPASGNCNMKCQYCFYHDVAENRKVSNYGLMSTDTLEQIVKKAFANTEKQVTFAFQGGEPTLIGLPFYETFIEYVNKYNTNHISTSFALQTNGISIDETWAKFLKANNFLVGISMDGPKEIHNVNRIDGAKRDTFNRVVKATRILDKYEVDYNILCVVTKYIARRPAKVYEFYRDNNYKFLQFIPCLDKFDEIGKAKYSLLPEDYGNFLCELFDLWFRDLVKGEYVSIRMFDNIVHMLKGKPPESCDMNGICSVNSVIEADGSVYPCDFYVLDEWRLGNINEKSFEELLSHELGKRFVTESVDKPKECLNCEFVNLCRTGCRRHNINSTVENNKGKLDDSKNYFCSSYKKFYAYTIDRFVQVAKTIQ